MSTTHSRPRVAGERSGPRPTPGRAPTRRRSPLADAFDRPLTSYYLVLGAGSMLLVLGLVMVLSASSIDSLRVFGSSFSYFQKQLLWCGLGVPLAWVLSRMPVRVLRWLAYPALIGTLGLLCLVPVIGLTVNGNTNWLAFGGFRLQPSELAKLALVIWGADLLARKERMTDSWKHLLVPLLPASFFVLGLVMLGHDLGTSLILAAVVASLLFFAGAPMRLFSMLAAGALGLVLVFVVTSPYRMVRIVGFAHQSAATTSANYQLMQSKYALGSGGMFGVGLGASKEKWGALPEQHTDFIFSVVGEELGLVGTVVVIALFAILGYAGFRIALRSSDTFIRLAAAGITSWLMVQTTVNLGAVLGVMPITGIPLPLVSYGGSSLLPTLLAVGMLLCFARHERGAAEALAARPAGVWGRILTGAGSGAGVPGPRAAARREQ